jgi:hypothetical protein
MRIKIKKIILIFNGMVKLKRKIKLTKRSKEKKNNKKIMKIKIKMKNENFFLLKGKIAKEKSI